MGWFVIPVREQGIASACVCLREILHLKVQFDTRQPQMCTCISATVTKWTITTFGSICPFLLRSRHCRFRTLRVTRANSPPVPIVLMTTNVGSKCGGLGYYFFRLSVLGFQATPSSRWAKFADKSLLKITGEALTDF